MTHAFKNRLFPKSWTFWISIVVWSVTAFLVISRNFPQDTWLTGWDNLHPEFDIVLNVRRALMGVWQGHQGLGHIGGHGYAATLLHSLFIGLLSFVVPVMHVRVVFTFLMLIVGSLGAWRLTDSILTKIGRQTHFGGLIAGLFYMLHLGTVQQFYVQLEPFIIFYGLLPWVLFTLIQYLESGSKKSLIGLVFANLLLSPIGFIPPLFVVYGMCLMIIFISYLFAGTGKLKLKKLFKSALLIFLINLYWLLPVAYYTASGGAQVYLESQNNQLSTQDFSLQSKSYGGIEDLVFLRGFVFGALDSPAESGGKVFYAMQPWHDHLNRIEVQLVGYGLFLIVLIGLVGLLFNKKRHYLGMAITGIFILMLVALGQGIPNIGSAFSLFEKIPLIGQAFRASFTKFSVPVVLVYAMLAGIGVSFITQLISRYVRRFSQITFILTIIMLAVFGWPTFQGEFFYERIKVNIPQEYFDLFEYLETQPVDQKIALMPATWQWGWDVHDWGYSGSGFMWYGVEQPILHRSFDVWSRENEGYFQQLRRALMLGNNELLANVLVKHDVAYVLVDTSIVYPGFGREATGIDTFYSLVNSWPQIDIVWNSENLTLYQIDLPHESISSPYSYVPINGVTPSYLREDLIFEQWGTYISGNEGTSYPFLDLIADRKLDSIDIGNEIRLRRSIPRGTHTLSLPGYEWGDLVPINYEFLNKNDQVLVNLQSAEPQIYIDGVEINNNTEESVTLETFSDIGFIALGDSVISLNDNENSSIGLLEFGQDTKIYGYGKASSETFEVTPTLFDQNAQKCWVRGGYEGDIDKSVEEGVITLSATDASSCLTSRIGTMDQDSQLFQLEFDYRSDTKGRPTICLVREEDSTRLCYNGETAAEYAPSPNWTKVVQNINLDRQGTYWVDVIGRSGDEEGANASIQYRNISIKIYDLIDSALIPQGFWSELGNGEKYEVEVLDGEIVAIYSPVENISWMPDIRGGKVDNCSVFDDGVIDSHTQFMSKTYYSKDGGVSCEPLYYPDLMLGKEYLIHLTGEHKKGRGLKFYLRDTEYGRQDFEELLEQRDFNVAYGVLSWPEKKGGYVVDLETRSFPSVTTEITLNNLVFYDFPISWLGKVYVTDFEDELRVENNLDIEDYTKLTSAFYEITTINGGLISLNQGYDGGWLGYQLKADRSQKSEVRSQLTMLMPWFFGERLEHVKVNGWSNGFIIGDDDSSQQSVDGSQIVILYWPQYLEWVGLGVLFLTFGFLSFKVLKDGK
jgi:hypothetical protein